MIRRAGSILKTWRIESCVVNLSNSFVHQSSYAVRQMSSASHSPPIKQLAKFNDAYKSQIVKLASSCWLRHSPPAPVYLLICSRSRAASLLICCELDRLSIIQRQPCCKPFPARPALLQSDHAGRRSLRTRLDLVCLNFVRCVFLDCGKGCALETKSSADRFTVQNCSDRF